MGLLKGRGTTGGAPSSEELMWMLKGQGATIPSSVWAARLGGVVEAKQGRQGYNDSQKPNWREERKEEGREGRREGLICSVCTFHQLHSC